MELRELGDRLLRLHAKLITIMVLAGVLAGLALHLRQQPQYQANARLVVGAEDPQNTAMAAALADTARGIATGPQLVGRAISETGARRDEAQVAATVNVQPIGSSGVLTLSVTDQDPQVAVKLANALAAGVVDTRATLIQSRLASSIRSLERREAFVNAQIRRLTAQINSLTAQIPITSLPGTVNSVATTQLSEMQTRLASLQDQATQIAVQRNQLAATQGPETKVLDTAASALRVPGRGLLDVLLGGLLGLVVGIALAAAREALRPSLVGAPAISRAIGVPLLGEMGTPPDSWTLASLPDAGSYIELAADSHHVQEVRFAALDPDGRRRARVRMLEGPLRRLQFGQPKRDPSPRAEHDGPLVVPKSAAAVGAADMADTDVDAKNSSRTGLVVAVPRVLKLADVDTLTNFIWISGWTLLGVIVYAPSKRRIKTTRGRPRPGDSQKDSSLGGHVEVGA
jgi:capsular polysaccharide biosynthesis protein